MFESTGYLGRLLISMFVVTVTPFLVAKLYRYFWSFKRNTKYKNKSLNEMIREEMWRLGKVGDIFKSDNPNNAKRKNYSLKRSPLEFYKNLMENPDFKLASKVRGVEKWLRLFEGDFSAMSEMEVHYRNLTGCTLLKRDIIFACEVLGTEDKLIFNEQRVLSENEFREWFLSISFARNLIDDVKKSSSTVSKKLITTKRFSEEQVFRAIQQMVICRSGASEIRVFENSFNQNNFLRNTFNNLSEDQLRKAIFQISKNSSGKPIGINSVLNLVKSQINRYDAFVKEYITKKRSEQEKKKQRKEENNSKGSSSRQSCRDSYRDPYEEYYQLLECHPSDSLSKIKKSYHRLAMKLHPDRINPSNELEIKKATERFNKIKDAFEKIESLKKSKAA